MKLNTKSFILDQNNTTDYKRGDKKVDVEKYLGFLMHDFLDAKFSLREVAKRALRCNLLKIVMPWKQI